MSDSPIRVTKDGFTLRVRLTPGAAHDRIDGPAADSSGAAYLAARVRARPEKGKANAALEALLADSLGAPKSAVSVERGGTSRVKTVHIRDDAALDAARRLFANTSGELG